jgi:DNA helicase-2/ATP-dependent DNA helicase PcrA
VRDRLKLILGGPGCGKTTRLLQIVEEEMAAGVSPNEIAFLAFTNAAANEAKQRAAEKFGLDPETDLPWFRTIHSLAYNRLGMSREEVMDKRDWKEFSALIGEPISGTYDPTEGVPTIGLKNKGDIMLRIVDYAATTLGSLEDVYHEMDEPLPWHELKRFDTAFSRYKTDSAKMDFTDMLLSFAQEGPGLKIRVGVVDEAQDLTKAQWAAVERAFENAERIYIGGDDDQAIYKWAGADVDTFLGLSSSPEVLALSHRLPLAVHTLAGRVSGRIRHRYAKHFTHSGRVGAVEYHVEPDAVDLSEGTWLLLARNGYMLARLEAMVREQGINYRTRTGPAVEPDDLRAMFLWERLRSGKQPDLSAADVRSLFKAMDRSVPQLRELTRYTVAEFGLDLGHPWFAALPGIPAVRRDFYLACLRRGEKIQQPPRVRIETIHGVKGAEADHVLMMTDLSHRTHKSFITAPDHEHRVFYVGATRARFSLHIIQPKTDRGYPM